MDEIKILKMKPNLMDHQNKISKLIDHNENTPLSNWFHFQIYFFMSYIYWRVTLVTGMDESDEKFQTQRIKIKIITIYQKKKVLLNLN